MREPVFTVQVLATESEARLFLYSCSCSCRVMVCQLEACETFDELPRMLPKVLRKVR